MRDISAWMLEYSKSHQNKTNIKIHKICVPLIMWSVLALLWAIPTPKILEGVNNIINFATLFSFFALLFYLVLSRKYFLYILPFILIMLYSVYLLAKTNFLLISAVIVFILSWIFQFIGHKIEGVKPSFLEDLAFLLIGPLWVLKSLFKLKE